VKSRTFRNILRNKFPRGSWLPQAIRIKRSGLWQSYKLANFFRGLESTRGSSLREIIGVQIDFTNDSE